MYIFVGHDVRFDISEENRIGFAESNCDYDDLVMDEMLGELEDIIEEIDVDEEEKEMIEKFIDEIEDEEVETKDRKSGSDIVMGQEAGTGMQIDRCESESCKYGFFIGVCAVGTVFFIAYKRKQRREQIKEYEIQAEEDDDLHLEREIQMTQVV